MLEINLPLLIVTVVIFLGLIFILNSVLYKPLLKFIDERNISIKNDEESVSKNASDVGAYQADIERIISDARSEANSIKQTALNLAKDEAAKKIQAKKESLETDYELFSKDLISKKDELKSMLLAKLPELKSGLSAKLSKI